MKIAFLIDVRFESLTELEQRVEDAVNSVGGRLIYRMVSKVPIRFIPAENSKYPPTHTGSEASGRVVTNGNEGNVGVRVDYGRHRSRGPIRGAGRVVPDVDSAGKRIQERDKRKRTRGGLGDVATDHHIGGNPPAHRVRIHAHGWAWFPVQPEAPTVEPDNALPLAGGPTFFAGERL